MRAIDPYEVLQVPRNATPDQIKRAHRRRARETHPDRGGDAARFQLVQLAHFVLSDPEHRKRYDETGRFEEPKPDNSRVVLTATLHQALVKVMQQLARQRRTLDRVDLPAEMRAVLDSELASIGEAAASAARAEKVFADALVRTSDAGGLLLQALQAEADRMQAHARMLKEQERAHRQALDYLAACLYRWERGAGACTSAAAAAGWTIRLS